MNNRELMCDIAEAAADPTFNFCSKRVFADITTRDHLCGTSTKRSNIHGK